MSKIVKVQKNGKLIDVIDCKLAHCSINLSKFSFPVKTGNVIFGKRSPVGESLFD